MWEDNNILKCDMALQYNFWLYLTIDLLDLTAVKKKPSKLLHGRLQLRVIEELEAVAKFSELRENQRLNV